MINNLKKIGIERSGWWFSFKVHYTETCTYDNGKWKLREHEPQAIYDNHLSLIKRYRRVRNIIHFAFAVHERASDGTFTLNDKKRLEVYYDHLFGRTTAILCYYKSINEIRREKLNEFLNPDKFEYVSSEITIDDIGFKIISAKERA